MSTAFINAVRQLYPDARIDVIIKKELSSIASLIPGIDKIYSFSKLDNPGLGGVYRFGKSLRTEKYDIFFTLPDSLSAAIMGKATGAKKRVGFSKEGGFFLLTKVCRRPKNTHRVLEYLSILEQFSGTVITQKKVSLQPEPQRQYSLILLNFNSEAESRRMPLDKGKQLLAMLTQAFPDIQFGLIGGPMDAIYVEELLQGAANLDRISNYCGKTTLLTLANLMAGARVLLSTDSGPAHMANAVGLPVVALFGAGDERNTAPYNPDKLTTIRAGQLACEPCVRNVCKLYGIPKCMQLLDEVRIINALSVYLSHA
jgi:heptosyltransferase-2